MQRCGARWVPFVLLSILRHAIVAPGRAKHCPCAWAKLTLPVSTERLDTVNAPNGENAPNNAPTKPDGAAGPARLRKAAQLWPITRPCPPARKELAPLSAGSTINATRSPNAACPSATKSSAVRARLRFAALAQRHKPMMRSAGYKQKRQMLMRGMGEAGGELPTPQDSLQCN